ncbi:MAG: 1-(5-phosphoribosyl)-5-[(5-phosphoribosylamino)methylideneamino] imidazole-4-carboxamide isomerase [Candidatus Omnitrophota bacterium]
MKVIPAIDLLDGKVVRLTKGKKDQCTVYSHEPKAVAQKFKDLGVKLLHVVDLSAAFGEGDNEELIKDIIGTGVKVEVGGGIRTIDKAKRILDLGAERIVIGTKALDDEFLSQALLDFSSSLMVSVDILEGRFMKAGWKEKSTYGFIEFAGYLLDKGVEWLIYTDISRDGTLSGPDFQGIKELSNFNRMRFIAAGGISSLDDLKRIYDELPFIWGVITGKAIYEGKIDLKEALSLYNNDG